MSSVPKLRFKEFSGEWKVEKFGELTKFQQGVQVDVELQSKEPQNGYIKFLRIENYTQNSQDLRYIPNDLAKNKTISENEIAVVRYGATAGFIGRGFNGVLANNLFKLVPNLSLLDTEYLFQYLKSHKVFSFFQSEMAGGAMPALSFGIVQVLRIPYPSIQEQQKIAFFLSAIDSKIDLLTRKKELFERYKKGGIQKIFSQELRFKADDGSEFPEWEEKKFGDVGDIITGKTPSTSDESLWDGNIQFVTPTDISDEKYQYKTLRTVTNHSKLKILPAGSIMFTCIASIGKMSLSTQPCITNQQINSIVPNNKHNNEYIYYAVLSISDFIKSTQANTTLPIINKTEFSKFEILVPDIDEQTKIANFLSSIDKKIELISEEIDKAKEFKKGLLQQMFV